MLAGARSIYAVARPAFGALAWRPVFSEANLLEIAFDGDKPRARRRAAFLDSLHPLWVMERLDIQKHEVAAFLRRHHFKAEARCFSVFREHLSQVTAYHTRPLIGANAAKWIASIDPSEIDAAKRLTVQSLRALQAATRQQKKAIEETTFRAWVEPKIPLRDPDGRLMGKAVREELASLCYASCARFYRECPTMGVEHFLCEARTRDPNRKPEEADAIDLQHGALALPYCDVR